MFAIIYFQLPNRFTCLLLEPVLLPTGTLRCWMVVTFIDPHENIHAWLVSASGTGSLPASHHGPHSQPLSSPHMDIKYKKVSLWIQGRVHDRGPSEASQLAQTFSKHHYGSLRAVISHTQRPWRKESVKRSLIKKHGGILWHIPLRCLVITELGWGSSSYSCSSVVCKYKDLSLIPQRSCKRAGRSGVY